VSWFLDLSARMEHTWDKHNCRQGPHMVTICDDPFLRRTAENWCLRNDRLRNHEHMKQMVEQVNDRLQEGRRHTHATVRIGEDHQDELLDMAEEQKAEK
jgi:hypothetical protein